MKIIRTLLALGFSLLAFAAAHAGTFSTAAWTDDASTGIVAGQTNWAYHFGSSAAATVNTTFNLPGIASTSPSPYSRTEFDLTLPTPAVFNNDTNDVTGTGSAVIANDFVYSNEPGGVLSVTVKGLTTGNTYTASFFSVGWWAASSRLQNFASGTDSQSVDQDQFGDNQGIRVDYTFTAAATTRLITISPQNASSRFHLYGLALRGFVVSTTADSGAGSLRQALVDAAAAPGANTITFAPALSGQTITLGSEIVIADAAGDTVDASALAAGVTINGNAHRIFSVSAGANVTLVCLTLTGGNATGATDSGNGGAIRSAGALTVDRCTFTGNTIPNAGAGIHNAAGGTLAVTQCTFSGNSAPDGGGAISTFNGVQVTVTHSTLSGNTGSFGGGGIYNFNGPLTLTNSIVAGNTSNADGGADICNEGSGVITPSGANLIGNNETVAGTFSFNLPLVGQPGSLANAQLAPLGSYGGPTQTMALLPTSPTNPARNAATGSTATSDQRGFPIVGTPDIGAYEAGTFTNYDVWSWETLPATATTPQRAATFDFDGDGQSNEAEWTALTGPDSGTSRFIATAQRNGAHLEISVLTAPDRTYTLFQSATLQSGSWSPVPGILPVAGNGNPHIFQFPIGSGEMFFQARVTIPPGPVAAPPPGMMLIPWGEFTMGDSLDGLSDATPTVSATVSAFYMDVNEVTLSQWQTVRSWGLSNGYTDLPAGSGKGPNHPVHTVSWYDVVKWCNAHSEQAGKTPVYYTNDAQTTIYKTGNVDVTNAQAKWTANGYRLPTEAEREKAARGGLDGKRFPWGDTISHSLANYYGDTTFAYDVSPTRGHHPTYAVGDHPYTSPVGSFAANGYGLNDMSGNVFEWCWDWWTPYAGGTDPHGAATGFIRVLRGGGWGGGGDSSRCARRGSRLPDYAAYIVGFRAVLTPDQP